MIVVFDAQFLLCNGGVQFLLRHDHRGAFRFASVQAPAGQPLPAQAGLEVSGLQTWLVVENGQAWQHTAAIFRVLHVLGWPWRLAGSICAPRQLVPAGGPSPVPAVWTLSHLHLAARRLCQPVPGSRLADTRLPRKRPFAALPEAPRGRPVTASGQAAPAWPGQRSRLPKSVSGAGPRATPCSRRAHGWMPSPKPPARVWRRKSTKTETGRGTWAEYGRMA